VQQSLKLLHHFVKSEIWQAVDKMENNSTRQKVYLVKISVCVCVCTEVMLVNKHYANTAWSIAGHFTGWDITKRLIKKLMCVANVNKFNKYFIHIIVYTQLFLICTSSLLTWNSLPILLLCKVYNYSVVRFTWFSVHKSLFISQILPCKLDLETLALYSPPTELVF